MPVEFDKEKKYLVISHPVRTSYYEEQKRRSSADIIILTLEQLEELFSSNCDKKELADREVIISGYYHSGDIIAHYLNSLSSHMAIGYEIDEGHGTFNPEEFPSFEDELEGALKLIRESENKGDVYLINLGERQIEVPDNAKVKVVTDFVAPLDSPFYAIGLFERKYSKREIRDLTRLINSNNLAFLSTCKKLWK